MSEALNESVRDFIRAAGGGLIIGLPLLFTMEVWFHGFILPWWKLLLLLGVAYAIVLGYNAIAGFRRERTLAELVVDSTAALGLGIVIALLALVVLGRIDGTTSLRDAAGKVALEALGWIVPVTVTNDGDQAAEAVVIEATAMVDGETESSELEVNFLPAGTEVEIAFAFSAAPEGEVSLRLVGYRVP